MVSLSLLIASLQVVSLAVARSPTGGYAPGKVDCPSGNLVREAKDLSSDEQAWIKERNKVTNENLATFLSQSGLSNFDAANFVSNTKNGRALKVGIAFSGGGYRAMFNGAGQLAALDNRTTGAHEHGLGGLLQSATYLTGLSGGSWLVGSIVLNNYTSVQNVLSGNILIWDVEHSIVNYGGWNPKKAINYYKDLHNAVQAKKDAGFELSITDTWGRALSHQFFPPANDYSASLCWSDIQTLDAFVNHQMPFPLVVADGRTPGSQIISGNSTVFEIGPYELGSWDPSLKSFTNVKYLGSKVSNGEPSGSDACVAGFDQAGFIMGTSSSLFNQFVLQINTTSLSTALKDLISSLLNDVSHDEDDIAIYKPNPFKYAEAASVQSIVNNDTLYLVDGGEDLQNVPLYPLIQKQRGLDVIFAYDNSADTNQSWPNGASLVATYQRQFLEQGQGTIFPHVPDVNTFRNLNLTARPTFFGCDAKNLTSLLSNTTSANSSYLVFDAPLIVYTANRPFTYWTNTSTFKLSYEDSERNGIIKNGFEVASRLNMTVDSDWRSCVACAIIRREQERQGVEQSDQCKRCFQKYCWDGTIDASEPKVNFTTEGTTNGNEDNGNRTVSAAASIMSYGLKYAIMQLLGTSFLVVMACTFNAI
ncbi:hypothetical protein PUMCH_005023 [Australozyma saopauloensis]|uniref:Lysophospholipase n=1 Tax=Australozyma saopauloensis TaxID=291208 RepID=A0AAX4HHL6_9ASCO|nr:hypothetical protein PUMCH_005023 [[Candida] saopauloensis]